MTKHIVALSGGKDSTVMALALAELELRNYIYICTPTGDELPEMDKHWHKLEELLGQEILRLTDPEHPTIYDLIEHFQMLPNWRARWCTRILKIEVAQQFYNARKPAKIYVGLRADEEKRKGNKLYDDDIDQVFPLREWGWDLECIQYYLQYRGVEIPRRTDCAMCFYQRIGEWWNLWKLYPDRFERIEQIEKRIGHTLLSPGKWKNWPSPLRELRVEFEKGRIPKGSVGYESDRCLVCNL
jgi:3'-phosphoadenosine 5'-phosphosulfate sulfotransferase (PAPS reductase)/FAD synthetase